MKLVLFTGNHPRHLFVNKEVVKYFDEALLIVMDREEVLPVPPSDISSTDKELFSKHFANRYKVETQVYGNLCAEQVFKDHETIFIKPSELNKIHIANRVSEFNADFCFIFGVDLILDPVIDRLPENKINLHLGLSPWYKGAATLYWPFYHLQPQFCGVTFHQINKQPDAGEIIHQCSPLLEFGDKIHDVGAKCVIQARKELNNIFRHWKNNTGFRGKVQKTSGRNWRGSDFHASQLRIIYNLFNDQIVDHYLSGDLGKKKPLLFSCLD